MKIRWNQAGRKLPASVLMLSISGLFAAEFPVSSTNSILVADGDVLVPATVEVGETLPDVGAAPIFWIDAADTNGWEFSANARIPSKIPSKAGLRYIKNYPEDGDSLVFNSHPYGAELVENGFNGRPYLDFSIENSGRGYLFNAVADESTAGVSSNVLNGIGTVIAVYGSQKGGGSFALGGGFGKAYDGSWGAGTLWSRGTVNGYEDSAYKYAVGMFSGKVHPSLFWAETYHDGVRVEPSRLGYSGGWQVISMICSGNDVQASGVGICNALYDAVTGKYKNGGGGMNIAELIVYGERLTAEQRLAVEAYLARKWFGRETPGANGLASAGRVRMFQNAVANKGVQAEIRVGTGEEIRIDALIGGRGTDPRVTKTGDGVLTVGTAGEYHGTVHVAGGTLKVAGFPAPDALPRAESIYVHLDSGADDGVVTEVRDGVEYVTEWKNLAVGRKTGGKSFSAKQTDAALQPTLVYDAKLGKKVVDFGRYKQGGKYLNFSTSSTEYSNTAVPYVGTILFVVDSEFGGCLFGANNDSGASARGKSGTLAGAGYPTASIWHKGYPAKVNGVAVNSNRESPETAGFHLLSTQYPGVSSCGRLAAYTDGKIAGGVRLAEVVIYDHVLTAEELRQAEAYLMRKWFGRVHPGFDTPYDIDKISVDAPSVIEIPGPDQVVKVRSLKLNAKLVKTGLGRLIVDAACNNEESGIGKRLEIRGGAFGFAETEDVAEDASAPLANPLFHIDASDPSTIVTNSNGVVRHWLEKGGVYENALVYSTGVENLCPRYSADGLGEGRPAVDFGGKLGYYGGSMDFVRPLDSIRTLYAVVGELDNGGFFLGLKGRSEDNWLNDELLTEFSRPSNPAAADPGTNRLFSAADSHRMVTLDGELFIDGNPVARTVAVDGGCHLIEVHASGNAYASAVARNAIGHLTGGLKIGEMIAYDRPLTGRERAATRNYLMKKWKGGIFHETLPEKPAESTAVELRLGDFESGEDSIYGVEGVWSMSRLKGDGDFAKYGDGILEVRDFSSYSGTVTVAEGTLKITGTPASGIPEYVPRKENILFHADAENGPEVITNTATGAQTCKIWRSANGNGWTAVTTNRWNSRPWTFSAAKVMPESLNGRRTVKFPSWNEAGALGGMEFMNPAGEVAQIGNIRSVLWVLGSQEGGGALLGGGASSTVNGERSSFFRGNASDKNATILHQGNSQPEVRNANWRINGADKVWSSVKLSGEWDTLSMVYKDDDAGTPTSADGFAFLSSLNYREGAGNYYGQSGFQRIAEVIIYDTVLTGEERLAAEHYLNRKWGLNGFAGEQDSPTNLSRLEVSAGAAVDLGGTNQYFAAVSGAGVVSNGTLTASTLVADAAAENVLDVKGTFALPAGAEIDLAGFGSLAGTKVEVPVLSAESFTGEENFSSVRFVSSDGSWDSDRVSVSLRFKDGVLFVSARRGGMTILVR